MPVLAAKYTRPTPVPLVPPPQFLLTRVRLSTVPRAVLGNILALISVASMAPSRAVAQGVSERHFLPSDRVLGVAVAAGHLAAAGRGEARRLRAHHAADKFPLEASTTTCRAFLPSLTENRGSVEWALAMAAKILPADGRVRHDEGWSVEGRRIVLLVMDEGDEGYG